MCKAAFSGRRTSLLCKPFCRQILFPRLPIVVRPTFVDAFVVVSRHAYMHQINFRAPCHACERQNQHGPIIFFPMVGPPELNDSFSRHDCDVLSTNCSAEGRKRAAWLTTYLCRSTSRQGMFSRIQIHLDQLPWAGSKSDFLMNDGSHPFSSTTVRSALEAAFRSGPKIMPNPKLFL